jgi:hypothetical protein
VIVSLWMFLALQEKNINDFERKKSKTNS